jgi:YYY domain-containing protein
MEFGLVALWLALLLLLGLLARPVAAWLLPGLDHDALAFPLALAVLGVVGHLVGHVRFGWPAGLAGLVVLGGATYWTRGRVDLDRRRYVEAAAVFSAAFLFMVGIRAVDPAAAPLPVAIGEKMLDFGLLRSLDRATVLPPEDMWFAGEPVRYHYGGHLLTALLAALVGTEARFTYNLALAGFYATLVTAAYGLAGSIATRYDVSRRSAAGFGAFFVGLAGNLDTPIRVLIWLLPDGVAAWLAAGFGYEAGVLEWTPTRFFYFDASRVFPIDPLNPNSYMAATEFPLFAWLNGDLHAHMMSQPFLLLAAALLLAYWRADGAPRRRVGLLFGALPPVVGLVGMINVWSLPSAGGLVWLAVAIAPGDPRDLLPDGLSAIPWVATGLEPREHWLAEEVRRVGLATGAAVVVLLLGLLWTLPFWVVAVLGGPGRTLTAWGRWTGLGGLLRVHGVFLGVLALYLVGASALEAESPRVLWAGALAGFGVAVLLGVPALGLALPLALGAWWLLRSSDAVGFESLLVLAGAGLVVLVELVAVEGERFNTVFKYYAHVWLFWSVASGVALARLTRGWPVAATSVSLPRWATIGRGVAVGAVVLASFYGAFALPAHVANPGPPVGQSGPTIDATAYLEPEFPAEAPAIRWLDGREGRATIVTAAPGGYWWRPAQGDGSSAPASLTGHPTVVGWFHERQYRGSGPYGERLDHIELIYAGPADRQRALLERYDVQYVYVGPAERATYGPITVGDLDGVSVAAEWDQVTIYRVDQSALGAS